VVKLDRLACSIRDVLNLVHDLEAKGAALTVLGPPFSTKDAAGAIPVTVLGMVAEMESIAPCQGRFDPYQMCPSPRSRIRL